MFTGLPKVYVPSEADPKIQGIINTLQNPLNVSSKQMGRVYRYLCSQTDWQNDLYPEATKYLKIFYEELHQSYLDKSLTPYQFYKCHFILPSQAHHDMQMAKEIFNPHNTGEQNLKIFHHSKTRWVSDVLFSGNINVISSEGSQFLMNKRLFLSLFPPEKKEELASLIDPEQGELNIELTHHSMELVQRVYNNQLPSNEWSLSELLIAYSLSKNGIAPEVFKDCLAVFNHKVANFHKNKIVITEEEALGALNIASIIPSCPFMLFHKLHLLIHQFYPKIYLACHNQQTYLEVNEFPIHHIRLLINQYVKSLHIHPTHFNHFLTCNQQQSYPSIEALILGKDQTLTQLEMKQIFEIFPKLKSLAVHGSTLTEENLLEIPEGLKNLCIIGSAPWIYYAVVVENVLHITDDPEDECIRAVKKCELTLPSNIKKVDFSSYPELPESFFYLFFLLRLPLEDINLRGCQFLSDESLRFLPTSLETLDIRECTQLSEKGLQKLQNYHRLKNLHLSHQTLTEPLIVGLFNRLESLSLKNMTTLPFESNILNPLSNIQKIKVDHTIPSHLLEILAIRSSAMEVKMTDCELLDERNLYHLLNTKKIVNLKNHTPQHFFPNIENQAMTTLTLKNFQKPLGLGIENFSNLSHLDLSSSYQVFEKCFMNLLPFLPNLQTLKLNYCTWVTNRILLSISQLSSLQVLEVRDGLLNINRDALENLGKNCKQLREIDITNCLGITSQDIEELRVKYPHITFKLTMLDINHA